MISSQLVCFPASAFETWRSGYLCWWTWSPLSQTSWIFWGPISFSYVCSSSLGYYVLRLLLISFSCSRFLVFQRSQKDIILQHGCWKSALLYRRLDWTWILLKFMRTLCFIGNQSRLPKFFNKTYHSLSRTDLLYQFNLYFSKTVKYIMQVNLYC